MEKEKIMERIKQIINNQADDFVLSIVDGTVSWKTLKRELTPEEWKSIGYIGGLAVGIDFENYRG